MKEVAIETNASSFTGIVFMSDENILVIKDVYCLKTCKKIPGTVTILKEDIISKKLLNKINDAKELNKPEISSKPQESVSSLYKKEVIANDKFDAEANILSELHQKDMFTIDQDHFPANPISKMTVYQLKSDYYFPDEKYSFEEMESFDPNNNTSNGYVFIDKFNDLFYLSIDSIKQCSIIGLSIEHSNIIDRKTRLLACISVYANNEVYIFDTLTLGEKVFTIGLNDILEDINIVKVIHDCRCASDYLNIRFDVQLANVFDTQVAEVMINLLGYNNNFKDNNYKHDYDRVNKQSIKLQSVMHSLLNHLSFSSQEIAFQKKNFDAFNENPELWNERPMLKQAIDFSLFKVVHLINLKSRMMEKMLVKFTDACDLYLSWFRDVDSSKLKKLQATMNTLPNEFQNLEKFGKESRYKAFLLKEKKSKKKLNQVNSKKSMKIDQYNNNYSYDYEYDGTSNWNNHERDNQETNKNNYSNFNEDSYYSNDICGNSDDKISNVNECTSELKAKYFNSIKNSNSTYNGDAYNTMNINNNANESYEKKNSLLEKMQINITDDKENVIINDTSNKTKFEKKKKFHENVDHLNEDLNSFKAEDENSLTFLSNFFAEQKLKALGNENVSKSEFNILPSGYEINNNQINEKTKHKKIMGYEDIIYNKCLIEEKLTGQSDLNKLELIDINDRIANFDKINKGNLMEQDNFIVKKSNYVHSEKINIILDINSSNSNGNFVEQIIKTSKNGTLSRVQSESSCSLPEHCFEDCEENFDIDNLDSNSKSLINKNNNLILLDNSSKIKSSFQSSVSSTNNNLVLPTRSNLIGISRGKLIVESMRQLQIKKS